MTKFMLRASVAALAISVYAAVAMPASATVTQIVSPDAAYLGSTTLIPIAAPDFTSLSSLTDGTLTVSFGNDVQARTVPADWATWGSPPDTEGATPRILYTNGAQSLDMTLSSAVTIFGFEAEPNNFALENFNVEYFLGGVSQGSFGRSINGNAGARLLAASGHFDEVVVSNLNEDDFSIAQVRYGTGALSAAPEPASWALMLIGFGGLGASLRAARRRAALTA